VVNRVVTLWGAALGVGLISSGITLALGSERQAIQVGVGAALFVWFGGLRWASR
jgi:hypothetical protein